MIKKGIYKHFKGQLYEVIELARHSETEEDYVVYRTLYGDRSTWVRPLSMFSEMIEYEGKTTRRFEFVEDGHTEVTR